VGGGVALGVTDDVAVALAAGADVAVAVGVASTPPVMVLEYPSSYRMLTLTIAPCPASVGNTTPVGEDSAIRAELSGSDRPHAPNNSPDRIDRHTNTYLTV
jgi:hypothetical protein